MLESDTAAYETAFRRLSSGFSKTWKGQDFREACRMYFEALRAYELADVLAAEVTLRTRPRWPKVADWIAAIPKPTPTSTAPRMMGRAEINEYLDARLRHYQGDAPCACLRCVSVGETRAPRFVPDDLPDDTVARAFCPALNAIVVSGHWAHGDELARWYAARDAFAAAIPRRRGLRVRRILALIGASREPGEEG